MKKQALLTLALATVLGLASCKNDGGDPSSTGNNDTSNTGSQNTNTTPIEDEKYLVVLHNVSGVTLSSDKAKAKEGETVTVTITVSAGYQVTGATVNGNPATITNNSFTFKMPNQDVDVRVSASLAAVAEGDITIGGAAVAQLKKEGDVFVARGVNFEEDGNIYVAINGKEGRYTPMGWKHYNKDRSFGSISFASGDKSTMEKASLPGNPDLSTNGKESLLHLGGNAAYDIYFDPSDNDEPLYIQRSEVTKLPTTADMLRKIFADVSVTGASYHPQGVVGVKYYDSRAKENYSWKKYKDSSLATIVNTDTEKTTYVYNAYDESKKLVTTVDTYLEGKTVTSPYPYASGARKDNIERWRAGDTFAFSENKKVVEGTVEYSDPEKHYKLSTRDTKELMAEYSHSIQDIDFAMYEAYRDSFKLEDDLQDVGLEVKSSKNENGTFSVNVDSYKSYTPSKDGTHKVMKEDTHIEYEMRLTFTKAGAPLTGKYYEYYYGSDSYDFKNKAKKPGTEGQLVKKLEYSYEYGKTPETAAVFDATPYFASSITAKIKGKSGVDNEVRGGWRSDLNDEPLEVKVSPSTALNAAQFGITASSNSDIIFKSHTYGGFEAGTATGTSTLTIANLVIGTPSTNIDVKVALTRHKGLMIADDPIHNPHFVSATTIAMYSDDIYTTRLYNSGELTNGGTKGSFEGMTVTSSRPDLLTATVDATKRAVTFVSRSTPVDVTGIVLTFNSPNYEPGWPATKMSASVSATKDPHLDTADFIGKWKFEENPGNSYLELKEETVTLANGKEWNKGTLHLDDDLTATRTHFKKIKVDFDFTWAFLNNTLVLGNVKVNWIEGEPVLEPTEIIMMNLKLAWEKPTDTGKLKVGICLYAEIGEFGTDPDVEELYGTVTPSSEDQATEPKDYVFMDKAS